MFQRTIPLIKRRKADFSQVLNLQDSTSLYSWTLIFFPDCPPYLSQDPNYSHQRKMKSEVFFKNEQLRRLRLTKFRYIKRKKLVYSSKNEIEVFSVYWEHSTLNATKERGIEHFPRPKDIPYLGYVAPKYTPCQYLWVLIFFCNFLAFSFVYLFESKISSASETKDKSTIYSFPHTAQKFCWCFDVFLWLLVKRGSLYAISLRQFVFRDEWSESYC